MAGDTAPSAFRFLSPAVQGPAWRGGYAGQQQSVGMSVYGFHDQIRMSQGVAVNAGVAEILLVQIPGALKAWRAEQQDDRNGTDWWVECESGHVLSIDVKARSTDYLATANKDDLALELFSDIDELKPGWSLRTDKRTDYILWFWEPTGRWCLVPFPMLCHVFRKYRDDWSKVYQHAVQWSIDGARRWRSECLFVDRKEVWRAIYRCYGKAFIKVPTGGSNGQP